ncbi:condensation protein, partial [Clostridium gasigenes]
IRNKMDLSGSFIDLLKLVKENSLKAYENQSLQFEELVDLISYKRVVGRNPVFDVAINMNNTKDNSTVVFEDTKLKGISTITSESKVDLSLSIYENEGTISLTLVYCVKLFKKQTIEKMINELQLVIDEILKNKGIKINDISVLNEEEKFIMIEEKSIIEDAKNMSFNFGI